MAQKPATILAGVIGLSVFALIIWWVASTFFAESPPTAAPSQPPATTPANSPVALQATPLPPTALPPTQPPPTEAPASPIASSAPPTQAPTGPVQLAAGSLYGLDNHKGSGRIALYRNEKGGHRLEFQNLNLQLGPDLRVYLVSIDPIPNQTSFDKMGNYVDLGALYQFSGNVSFDIPNNVDVSSFKSVLVWCRAFSVSFVAAPLARSTSELETAPAQTHQSPPPVNLPNFGDAPEITNQVWINSESPLRLAELRGQVVLVDFWTFGCYNCQNVLPSLKKWHEKYSSANFKLVSVHYPEFTYEREYKNVEEAVKRYGIAYPVAIDNDGVTWGAYQQRYWPTWYVVDQNGDIRYKHIGEGGYEETEKAIEALLGL